MIAKCTIIIALCTLILVLLTGCQQENISPAPVEVQALEEPYRTETPVAACVSLPDVKLDVILLSENSAQIRVTGLQPGEPVYTIFSSQRDDHRKRSVECCPAETANEEGVYEYSVGLRGSDIDSDFTDWQVRVIHSQGATCTEFKLPAQ